MDHISEYAKEKHYLDLKKYTKDIVIDIGE